MELNEFYYKSSALCYNGMWSASARSESTRDLPHTQNQTGQRDEKKEEGGRYVSSQDDASCDKRQIW